MNTSTLKASVLLVPVLILGGLSLLHAYNQRNGVLWQVPIEGYDPRDLLSGHYLQFRYAWNLADSPLPPPCQGDACALCAEDPAALNPVVSVQSLELAGAQCPGFIAGSVDADGNFLIAGDATTLTRYYIPEDEAQRLDQLLRDQAIDSPRFVMGLRVNAAGTAFVDTLYLDGEPLREWLQNR